MFVVNGWAEYWLYADLASNPSSLRLWLFLVFLIPEVELERDISLLFFVLEPSAISGASSLKSLKMRARASLYLLSRSSLVNVALSLRMLGSSSLPLPPPVSEVAIDGLVGLTAIGLTDGCSRSGYSRTLRLMIFRVGAVISSVLPLKPGSVPMSGGGLKMLTSSQSGEEGHLQSTVRRPVNAHRSHGVINEMTKEVVICKFVRKHPIERVRLG